MVTILNSIQSTPLETRLYLKSSGPKKPSSLQVVASAIDLFKAHKKRVQEAEKLPSDSDRISQSEITRRSVMHCREDIVRIQRGNLYVVSYDLLERKLFELCQVCCEELRLGIGVRPEKYDVYTLLDYLREVAGLDLRDAINSTSLLNKLRDVRHAVLFNDFKMDKQQAQRILSLQRDFLCVNENNQLVFSLTFSSTFTGYCIELLECLQVALISAVALRNPENSSLSKYFSTSS